MTVIPLGIYGGYVKAGSGTCSFLLEEDGKRILLDIGSGSLVNLERYCSIDDISAILISHEHADHIADLETALYGRLISMQLGKSSDPLSIYGPDIEWLKGRIEKHASSIYNSVDEKRELCIGPFTISAYRMEHECLCYGYFIRSENSSLFYSSDTVFSESLAAKIPHADMMLIECSIYDRFGSGRQYGHMNGEETAEFLSIARPEKSLLVHLPCYGDSSELLLKVKEHYSGDVSIAELGRIYTV